jgi:hypothetical protein
MCPLIRAEIVRSYRTWSTSKQAGWIPHTQGSSFRLHDCHGADIEPRLTPGFVIQAETLFLDPLAMFAAPVSALGTIAGSFAADGGASRISAAIDAVITQAFG